MATTRKLIAPLAIALTVPAVALAAGGNSVKIKAPHKPTLGSSFNYSVKGNSAGKNVLSTFLNTATKCKKTYKKERALASPPRSNELKNKVKGSYKKGFSVTTASVGTHYICAYLHKHSGKTVVKASAKYVTS